MQYITILLTDTMTKMGKLFVGRRRLLAFAIGSLLAATTMAQTYVHKQSETYQWPDDPAVVAKLHQWQDLKFGIILHWGLYSVPGMVESWQITSEDWITPDTTRTYDAYKQWYWGLINQFNPVKFNPEQWAKVAKDAGMKYVVFTTKHHDGFCLFDSKQTDFTVTHSAFKDNPRADAAKYVFEAFRKEGMWAGCYFSKPDWHCPYYWWPAKATPDRHHNYSISHYPQRWAQYKSYVYNQVAELMHNYGKMDILWLDGGWCTAPKEDIGLDSIVDMARKAQPGLIVVERACPGKHENYQTPEQTIPAEQLTNPWESCITLTNDWGWTKHPVYKSTGKVIATLCEIVAKGGSLLLGVGPTPEGVIEEQEVKELHRIGLWMKANGEAIYGTVITPVYTNEARNVWFTANKDGKRMYALVPQHDGIAYPATVEWQGNVPKKGSKITDLRSGKALKWMIRGDKVLVTLPEDAGMSNGLALRFYTK